MVIADQSLKPGKRLQRCKHVHAMRQRFVEGLDWHQTKYSVLFEKKYKQFIKGKSYRKGGFKAFLSEKFEWYDAIYQDIERNGYRRSDSIENNVEVALAANGDLLLIDGRHRLILAQLLGLKKIAVVVNLVAEVSQDPCSIVRIIQPLVPTKKAKEPLRNSGCLVITFLWL